MVKKVRQGKSAVQKADSAAQGMGSPAAGLTAQAGSLEPGTGNREPAAPDHRDPVQDPTHWQGTSASDTFQSGGGQSDGGGASGTWDNDRSSGGND